MNDQAQDNSAMAALLVPDAAAEFVRRFYQNVPDEDIAGRDPVSLAAAALSLWQFAQTRPPEAAILRLLPPTLSPVSDRPMIDGRVVVEIVNDDMPFLVDTVTATLAALGLTVRLVIHPVVWVAREASGERTQEASVPAQPESMMRVELSGRMTEARGHAVVRRLSDVLQDVRIVVGDWPAIRGKVLQMAADLGGPTSPSPFRAEAAAFLDWISDDNFVFLGFREYGFTTDGLFLTGASGLGLLRDEAFLVFDGLRDLSARSAEVKAFLRTASPMMLSKSLRRSTVHRLLPMDTIGVKLFSETGAVIGMRLVIGLFTRASYFRPPASVPMLRQKLRRCAERAGFAADSHDGRALSRILAAFPRDELLQIDEASLYQTAIGLLHLEQRPRIALFVLRDPFERFVTGLVYLPAERYNSEVRARMAAILAGAFGGSVMSDSTRFDESPLARIHFMIATTPGQVIAPNIAALEQELVEAGRIWSDRLADALSRLRDDGTADLLQRRFAEAFPTAYTARFTAAEAVADTALVAQVEAGVALAARLDLLETGALRLKTCQAGTPAALSDMLPLLENLGVRVLNEIPFEISPREGGVVWLQEFSLQPRDGIPTAEALPLFEAALRTVWAGDVENDSLHRLILSAGLDVQQIVILRAYCKIFRQTGTLFSQPYIEATMAAHPKLARDMVVLFEAQFDPEGADETHAAALALGIEAALEDVANLDEDRILRSFLLLIRASLRTNRYRPGRSYLSIKLASRELDLLPLPRPLVEIHVYSPRMEGCHLRGGRVARGGIRWSDRREDFRTEILGLMKAQMVKNAVIVPVGSKGGFVVKRPPAGRDLLMEEVVACYQTLIRGLLDLTDNIVGADIVPPPNVVRRDGDDPYLVVAADKGTATFSDIANALSRDYGFWLGDAFASGGSVGYDHKAMGITARGAWEAVKRHFRELGRDIQTAPFSCIGIGDMSGDVFGNGMLLSRQTRLLAAFNHMHIFIDPDPDRAVSWAERARLFAMPGSTWADYSVDAVSKGGGVFARGAKTLTLSPEAQAVFALSQASMTPNELISHLLRQPADLLWFGGIGTYVKASTEAHQDAGDRVNDALRVDANCLRALVVGEGANLGVTQRGRIEYALRGGRINTDAIDNSAGVDTSDHEVNIKIGVGAMVDAGLLTEAGRAAFLASLTDDVARHVLVDNVLQTQALSLAAAEGAEALERHARLMRALEREQNLNRAVEFLPDDKALAQRETAGAGFTRPELAVLMAYAKNAIYDALLPDEMLNHTDLDAELLRYFPAAMQNAVILRHRLRREIIATSLANTMVNRMGISFVADTSEVTGAPVGAVARAFLIVREIFALPSCWAAIEALDNVAPADTQLALLQEVAVAAEQAVRWFLTSGVALDIAARQQEFAAGFAALSAGPAPTASRDDVPDALAMQVARLSQLATCMDIVQIAEASGFAMMKVSAVYFAVGEVLGLEPLRARARNLPGGTTWARMARDSLVQDSYTMQRRLAQSVVSEGADLMQWRAHRGRDLGQIDGLLTEMQRTSTPDLALLGVVARRIAALA